MLLLDNIRKNNGHFTYTTVHNKITSFSYIMNYGRIQKYDGKECTLATIDSFEIKKMVPCVFHP